ncbi:MAG: NeuD/PglB/VioB family sugar acetyltransferase [Elusimicrobia bacterium]|nr:NeuD/PglB/VioB family sugar acetyltransferase [Elusimicrobiota bacterium]
MKKKTFVLLGAGGHAKVVLAALDSMGREAAALLDADKALWGTDLEGVKIAGGDDKLADYPPSRHEAAIGVGAARDTRLRRRLHEAAAAAGYALPPVVAASAFVARSARLGAGAQVLTRAVVHPGASIGAGAVVNTAAVVEHDCAVGDHAFVGPAAVLCGGAALGAGAFIGAGAVVLPGVRIGAGALVAAGATVSRDVAEGAVERGR